LSLWAGFVSLAKSNHNLLIIFGILLFNISDYIVIYTIVNSNVPSGLEYIVWLTYLLSIWCISCVGKNPIKFLFPN
jgi:hypothetical protein